MLLTLFSVYLIGRKINLEPAKFIALNSYRIVFAEARRVISELYRILGNKTKVVRNIRTYLRTIMSSPYHVYSDHMVSYIYILWTWNG